MPSSGGGGTLLPDTPPQSSNSLDNELKAPYNTGGLSPSRLSPNIFLNLNIDHLGLERGGSGLSMEWSTYPPSTPATQPEQATHHHQQQQQQHSHQQPPSHSHPHHELDPQQQICTLDAVQHQALASAFGASLDLDMTDGSAGYDEMKFLGVDQFTIDSFKADCILSMEHEQPLTHASSSVYESHSQPSLAHDNGVLHSLCLDPSFGSLSLLSSHADTEPKSPPPSLLVLDKTLPSLSIGVGVGVDGIGDLVEQLHHHNPHDVGV